MTAAREVSGITSIVPLLKWRCDALDDTQQLKTEKNRGLLVV